MPLRNYLLTTTANYHNYACIFSDVQVLVEFTGKSPECESTHHFGMIYDNAYNLLS